MRTRWLLISWIAAGALSGCGGEQQPVGESVLPATSELHGGVLVPLTENQAYVELLNGKGMLKDRKVETTVEAYLLQPDKKTPFAEKPSAVEVKIDTPTGQQTVPLKPAPDSSDPAGGSHFVSDPGPFELAQVGGEVTVQVGGKTLTGKFRGPR